MTDAKAFIGWLDRQSSVAKNRKMGTQDIAWVARWLSGPQPPHPIAWAR